MAETNWLEDDVQVIEEPTAVANAPRFDELSIFRTPGDVAEAIRAQLLESYSSIEGYVIAKRWSEVFAEAETLMKNDAMNQTNDKKTEVRLAGRHVATVTERNLPAKWDYSADANWVALNDRMDVLKQEIKDYEKLLQTIKADTVDAATGTVSIPAKKTSAGITIAVKFEGGK